MIFDNPILNCAIGLAFTFWGFYFAKSILEDHRLGEKYGAKIEKWTEWSAGSITNFGSGVMAFVIGFLMVIISLSNLL